ncbi:MAG: hypothetical protein ABIZ80_26265 [Bryobacteraceae bacterium]
MRRQVCTGQAVAIAAMLLSIPLGAQTPQEAKPVEAAAAAVAAVESPSPVSTPRVTGTLDFGERFLAGIGGNREVYRSIVNLGAGPKLLGLDVNIKDPGRRVFDSLLIRATQWGGEPASSLRVDLRRERVYRLITDYRNIAYYNFVPSFANPAADLGVLQSQRSYDLQRRLIDTELEIFPGTRFLPYLAYTRDSNSGTGVTDFVTQGNEYPVATNYRDKTDQFRGGIRMQWARAHLTLEEGGFTFKDDQRVFTSDRNAGNRSTPLFDQRLFLSQLQQSYAVRAHGTFSRMALVADPLSWMTVSASFLYTQASSDASYTQGNSGLFAGAAVPLSFTSERSFLSSSARQPHPAGSLTVELRPLKRLRLIETWMTDRLHVSSVALLGNQILTPASAAQQSAVQSTDRPVVNFNRQQFEAQYDVTRRLMLRAGHRYVWGESSFRAPQLAGGVGLESAELRQNVALAGLSFRAAKDLTTNVDFEGASSDRTYFRTSLHNYQRLRARARYQALASLQVGVNFFLLHNDNPGVSGEANSESREASISTIWTPGLALRGFGKITLLGEYMRSTFRSNYTYVIPQELAPALSRYRENAHTGTALLEGSLPGIGKSIPRFSAGGALFVSAGSRPASFYQPIGKFTLPLRRRVEVSAEWRWHGFAETFQRFEGFRTHQFTAGIHLVRGEGQ